MGFNVNADGKLKYMAIFNSLDMKDGKADNKIQASIWNEFADKVGGKHIKNFIEWSNAKKSIISYLKRGGEAVQKVIKEYLGYSDETAQKNLDDAEKMLNDVASDPSSAEILKDDKQRAKTAKLPDGRWIKVFYDKKGKIEEIIVSTNTKKYDECDGDGSKKDFDSCEVSFNKEGIFIDAENTEAKARNHVFEYDIRSGYDFEKYKTLAEKIFGAKY